MKKSGVISARVNPSVKGDADRVLTALGLSVSEAVSIFLTQVVIHRGLPFPIELPQSVDLDAFLAPKEDDGKEAAYDAVYAVEYAVPYAAENAIEEAGNAIEESVAESAGEESNGSATHRTAGCGDGSSGRDRTDPSACAAPAEV